MHPMPDCIRITINRYHATFMNDLIDLHMHSTASDGTDTPTELARRAAEVGLGAIALTDHDSTDGLDECAAACAAAGVVFVPGIEISCRRGKEVGAMHMLGYFVDPASAVLAELSRQLAEVRTGRVPLILERLTELGVDIRMDEVLAATPGAMIGRPHVAAVLVDKGYARTIADAFARYLGSGAPAYVRKDNLPTAQAIDAIHQAGGLAVLAHPLQLRCDDDDELELVVRRLVDEGLDGLEVCHSDHAAGDARKYRKLADRFDLAITGGSDYHGYRKDIKLGSLRVGRDVLDALRQRHAQGPNRPAGV